jgi:hypothetical protein
MTLFTTFLFANSSDSQAAVACTHQPVCPLTAVNALSTGIGGTEHDNQYGGENAGVTWTWTTNTYPNYGVHGTHWCATNGGTHAVEGTPSGYNGSYCWCKLLGINNDSCAGSWVFNYYSGPDRSYCSLDCAYNCASNIRNTAGFRAVVVSAP